MHVNILGKITQNIQVEMKWWLEEEEKTRWLKLRSLLFDSSIHTEKSINIYLKLIILYSTSLILIDQILESMKIIEEYGMKVQKNSLYQGNIHKLMSVILYLDN